MKTKNTLKVDEALEDIAKKTGLDAAYISDIFNTLQARETYSDGLILGEMRWFIDILGLDAFYFKTTPPPIVADHIESLFAGKLLGKSSTEEVSQVWETAHDGRILIACHDRHDLTNRIERRIDEQYHNHRMRSYRSKGATDPESDTHFRLYFITPSNAGETISHAERVPDLTAIADKDMFLTMSENTKERYRGIVEAAKQSEGPVITAVERRRRGTLNLLVAYKRGSTHSYFSAISDLLHAYGIVAERAYIEQFTTGIVLYSIHIPLSTQKGIVENLKEDISLFYALPRTSLTPLFQQGSLTAQEVTYAYAALRFTCQFLTRARKTYAALAPAFKDDPVKLGLLRSMRHRLNKDTFTQERVTETINTFPAAIKLLYRNFFDTHGGTEAGRAPAYDAAGAEEIRKHLLKTASTEIDIAVLESFLDFNRYVTATNFYRSSKLALSFRLDPTFLSDIDYPDTPYAVFLVVGSEFRGFHVRFRNIARGGIRIISSSNHQAFVHNSDMLFHECYQLAHTQQKKNKDIPEGGSKGVILLSFEHPTKGKTAFKKYVDALLDLVLEETGSSNDSDEQELLFLGPDEGTAELMDWASAHARKRGYPYWKSFTTGKSQAAGGIPHDRYGMTTHSVHQYVLGLLHRHGLDETEITKLQTGGPDGDLGSNEIRVSKDKTVAVVDGSGVLHDPNGIDREALLGLAERRLPISEFDRARIGENGYLVTVDDRDIRLPDGTPVESGLVFRNTFHLSPRARADLFVPCGGRPGAVHINNVAQLLDGDGAPRFRFIVEGANLFFTPEARLALEEAGAVIIKDASANKGGVTSSSLEVLAGLTLTDDAFEALMTVQVDQAPPFYETYVDQTKEIIARNARLELECILRERERTGEPSSRLSDAVSDKINTLTDALLTSPLSRNASLVRAVIDESIPKILADEIGLDTVIERLPSAYRQALFAAHLAGRYVYTYGLAASETHFVEFLHRYDSEI